MPSHASPLPIDEQTRSLIALALKEDCAQEDVTSIWTLPADRTAHAELISRQEGILCGGQLFQEVFRQVDSDLVFGSFLPDGTALAPGTQAARVHGLARSILAAERVALNLIGRLSGISTATSIYVKAVEGTSAKICDTRKTTPLWRMWEKYAVRTGGGVNHRMSLSDSVLIKDNHAAVVGSPARALKLVQARNVQHIPVEVEVQTLDELRDVLALQPERVLLDNMSPETMAQAVAMNSGKTLLEASGGVNLATVRKVAESGVDLISIGALTHSVQNFDFSLEIILDA